MGYGESVHSRVLSQILLIALALLLLLVGAGCGSKKNASSTSTTSSTAAAIVIQTGALPTTPGSTTTTTAPGIGALGSIANCKQIAGLGPALEQALQGTNGDVQKELAVLQAFAAKTPAAIRPDFETIATAFTKVA